MRTFEVWVEYYDDEEEGTISTPTLDVSALTAKIALAHSLSFFEAYIPDGLSVSEITVVCQDKENEFGIVFEPEEDE